MSSRLIIAAADISSSPVLAKKFRGKATKEIYRCGKGIILTGSISKPLGFAVATVSREMSKGFIYTAGGQVGEATLGYISGIGFIRYIYKVAKPEKIKVTARVLYNVACLPLTVYSKGVTATFDVLRISKLEEIWFGEPIYIFNDNRLWIEGNFTIDNIFQHITEDDLNCLWTPGYLF